MMDVNSRVENPALVSAMETLQADNNEKNERAFVQLLQAAQFLLPAQRPSEGAEPGGASEGDALSLPVLSDNAGGLLLPAFTDRPALRAWRDTADLRTLVVPFSGWLGLLAHEGTQFTGFVINPGIHGFIVPREAIVSICGQSAPPKKEQPQKVLVGKPAEHPQALADAVSEALRALPEVRRAWLLLMLRGEEKSFLIVLDHTGERAAVNRAVGAAASPHLPEGMFLDFVSYAEPFGQNAVKNHTPLYTRAQ